jgi:NADH dehydrogenase/putative oxidoreductase
MNSRHLDIRDTHEWALARLGLDLARSLIELATPFVDLGIRLALAQAFFLSGLLKVSNWANALYLSAHEYPVSWLDHRTAAYLGAAVELICPVFLALGLFTRLASLPLLALALVIQFAYQPLDTNLYWTALFGWFALNGPGPLSLDRQLAPGLARSAIPLAECGVRLARWLSLRGVPWYSLALRLWLGAALAGFSLWPSYFPATTMQGLPSAAAAAAGAALVLGLATPAVALTLALPMFTVGIMEPGTQTLYGPMLLILLALHGAGLYSLDRLIIRAATRRLMKTSGTNIADWPHVVIVGAGFGGLACAIKLRFLPVRVTLIDRRNFHLFQPLLYQVATASLSPGDVATPIRSIFRQARNTRVLRGTVTGIDSRNRRVTVDDQTIDFDFLVIATGASHSYFGKDQWAPFAPGLKRVEDATEIRGRILSAFERAELAADPEARDHNLTFAIVGGGPTGVELAGAVAELARHGLTGEFRNIDPAGARIILIQSGPRLLPAFPESLSAIARKSLEGLGVEVRLNSRVEAIDADGATVSGTRIRAATVLWAAGVTASPAARWLGVAADAAGRVEVGPDLSIPSLPDVFVIGDTAASNGWAGKPVPGLAPAAKQGGEYVARIIRARLLSRKAPPPFRYSHRGSLATIGRKSAVADFGRIRLSGAAAWWLWGLVHVYFLVGLRNRLAVMLDWFWAYLTYRVGIRLITGDDMYKSSEIGIVPLSKAS